MGLDNPLHIAFIVVILLLIFGAKRLPEMGRSLGGGMREFKEAISGEANKPGLSQTAQQPQATPQQAAAPAATPQQAAQAFGEPPPVVVPAEQPSQQS
jgi:sec-independent protein translocase protein TatA